MSSIAIAKALREHSRRLSLDHTDGTVSAAQLSQAAAALGIVETKEESAPTPAATTKNGSGKIVAKCYKCGGTGHYAYACPNATDAATATATKTPSSSSSSAEPSVTATPTTTTPTTTTKKNTVAEHVDLTDVSLDRENEPPGLYNDISRSESDNDVSSSDDEEEDNDNNHLYGQPLDELYTLHRARMDRFKTKLQTTKQHVGDDLWLLRYVLSFENIDRAVQAASLSNEWRAQVGISELIQEVSNGTFFKGHLATHVHKYLCCGTLQTSDSDGGPVFVIRAGLSRPTLLMDRLTKADVSYYLLAQREHMFQTCDHLSKQTNTLIKGTMIIDLLDVSMTEIWNDSRFRDVNAAVSQLSGSLYPQMTDKTIVVNPPSYFGWVYNILSKLVSTRLTKKVIVVPSPTQGETINLFTINSIQKYFTKSHLPIFLGGALNNTALLPELTGELVDLKDEWCNEILIGARSKKAIRMTVPLAGTLLRHTLSVANWDIKYTVTLHKGDVTVVEWEDSDGTPHVGTKFSPNGEQEVLVDDVMIFSQNGASTETTVVNDCGQLVIEFDNSFSFLTSKTVKYRFDQMGTERTRDKKDVEL